MGLFEKRPLALICTAAVALMLFALDMPASVRILMLSVLIAGTFVSLTGVFLFRNSKPIAAKRSLAVTVLLVISAVLVFECHVFSSKSELAGSFEQTTVSVVGTVTDVRYKSSAESSLEVEISSLDGKDADLAMILEIPSHSTLKKGDGFTAIGTASQLSFSDEYYLMADGINGKIICESSNDVKLKGISENGSDTLAERINGYFEHVLYQNTDSETGSLVSALLLGNRDELDASTVRDFRRCGIGHMLALSGLHMTVVIGFFDFIMKNFLIDKKIRCIILAFLALAYLAITGFSPSASRAVIMLCAVYFAYLVNDEAESITSLFMALTVILLFSPYAVYDVGLWMSFFATMGIIVVSDAISKIRYLIKKKPLYTRILINITTSIALTLAAVFSLCVFSWLCFGEISLVSPITNLIFSPIMTLILAIALLIIIFSPIPFVAEFLGNVLVYVTSWFTDLISRVSHMRGITVSLKYDFVPYIIIPLAVALAVMLIIKLKRKWLIAIPPILAVIAFALSLNGYYNLNSNVSTVTYMKDKRSEMLLIQAASEISICDISTGGYANIYNACAVAINNCKATEIENLIVTHYHNFHVKSLDRICREYMVRNVYIPLPESDSEYVLEAEIISLLKESDTNVIVYKRGAEISTENTVISVTDAEYIERSTHPIFAVCVSRDTKSLTYSTAAVEEAEGEFLPSNTDIFIFGSHGPTVKPLADKSFLDSKFDSIPDVVMYTSPREMLENKDMLSYVLSVYQSGNKVILDETVIYEFYLS